MIELQRRGATTTVPHQTHQTPLSRFITEEMERLGMSRRQVAVRGGLKPETLTYYVSGRWPAKKLPSAEILQGIADGLGAPLARVQAVALASTGQQVASGLTADQQAVTTAMSNLTERHQRAIADMVLRIVQEFDETQQLNP